MLHEIFILCLLLGPSRAKDKHYFVQTWPSRKSLEPDDKNAINKPVVASSGHITPTIPYQVGIDLKKCESS